MTSTQFFKLASLATAYWRQTDKWCVHDGGERRTATQSERKPRDKKNPLTILNRKSARSNARKRGAKNAPFGGLLLVVAHKHAL